MLHSRFPSSIKHLTAALAVASLGSGTAGCGEDCGPGGAPETGLVLAGADVNLEYGALSAVPGGDCPDPMAPEGVVSLTILGDAVGGTGSLTFCVPRPDQMMEGPLTLGRIGNQDAGSEFRIAVLSGMAAGCSYTFDSTRAPTGTASASGVCDNGDSPNGFAIELDGAFRLRRTCGTTTDFVDATLRGRVAVAN